jgi:hypothetical protein
MKQKFCQWMHQGFFMRSKRKPEGKKVTKLSGTDRNTPARLQQSRFSLFRVPNIAKPF